MPDYLKKILCTLATLGPIGYLPAPGTAGSLVALIAGWFIASYGFLALAIAALAALLVGIVASETYSQATDSKDASEVIIDEVAGQWVVLLCIPPFIDEAYLWYGVAFILFRFFDITKIGPVGMAEKLGGGIGIMADDIVAGGLAGMCLLALQFGVYAL
ncbi:MAG: phosphatidylglycerophosphatase A [Candidatus Puniceispirillaceae bacterium]